MTLVKTTPTPVKTFVIAKTAVSSPTGKSPPTMKKPVDVTSSLKKLPAPSSPIKGKPMPVPKKPATKTEPSVVKVEKSPIKMEKSSLKLTVTKASINSTIQMPPAMNKSPVSKSPATETRTPIRNVVKPIITPRTSEQKELNSKKEISTVRSPEKLTGNKTNVNSVSVSKTPRKSSSVVKNTLLSPVKSVSSPTKSVSPPIKSILSPVKSMSPPTTLVCSPIKSISSSTKLISSPAKSLSSPIKSVASPIKSISSPIKSILSPIKPKITREVNLSCAGKMKETKATQLSPTSLIKKPLNLLKSPIKPIQSSTGKVDSSKLKRSAKSLLTSKVVKNNSTSTETLVKKQPTIAATVEVGNISPCVVEKVDLCHCDDTMKEGEESSNSSDLITEYTIDNTSNFDVVQAFKVAEQLIKIQSNDRNLETIIETCENNSVINWDDVITPCDDFAVANSNDKIELTSLEQNHLDVSSYNAEESASKCDSCIIETANSNYTADSQVLDTKPPEQNYKLVISTNRDENNNIIELTDVTASSCTSSQFSEIELNDEKYFTNELSCKTTDDDLIRNHNDENESTEIESNDEKYSTKELSFDCADDLIENNCDENVLPEWTITIDEFSLDLSQKETQSSEVCEKEAEKKNYIADETHCTVGPSYADILKKTPNVFANSTNLEFYRKEPKLSDDSQIEAYKMIKKGKASCSKNTHSDDIENSYHNCNFYEDLEYGEMRKKKHKKIKHLSKRHFRNINREYEFTESHNDIFVTHVWKNIY